MGANIELIWKRSSTTGTAIHFLQLRRRRVVESPTCLKLNDLRFRQRWWPGQRLRSSTATSITPLPPKSIGPPPPPPSSDSESPWVWVVVLKKSSAVIAVAVALVLMQLSNPLCASASRVIRRLSSQETEKESKPDEETRPDIISYLFLIIFVANVLLEMTQALTETQTQTQVLMLQVGLFGTTSSVQTDLNRSAASLIPPYETIDVLLRHLHHCIFVNTLDCHKENLVEGEMMFNRLSTQEREKSKETLVDVNNEYIVVTILILVGCEGSRRVAPIQGRIELKEILETLRRIPPSRIMAVDVLFTPHPHPHPRPHGMETTLFHLFDQCGVRLVMGSRNGCCYGCPPY